MEVEEFVHSIYYSYLQVSPKEKPVFLCYSIMTPFTLVKLICEVLFTSYNVPTIYFLNSNALPIFIFPNNTGLVVDCGYFSTQVMSVLRGELIKQAYKATNLGMFFVKNKLNAILMEENHQIRYPATVLEDIIARFGIVLTLEQKNEFLKEENKAKMKSQKYRTEVNNTIVNMSFYSRIMCGEALFGDVENEEGNVAFTILKSIVKVNIKYIIF